MTFKGGFVDNAKGLRFIINIVGDFIYKFKAEQANDVGWVGEKVY